MVQEIKICVLGSGAVGKSALTVQFVQGVFVARYDPTIEDSYRRSLEVDGTNVVLEILDTAGTEQFGAMRDLYMKDSEAFVLVYSIVAKQSLSELQEMYEQLVRVRDGAENAFVVLVGNKCDLEDSRVVSREMGSQKATAWNAEFFECSAKTGDGVQDLFLDVVRRVLAHRAEHAKNREANAKSNKAKKMMNNACTLL